MLGSCPFSISKSLYVIVQILGGPTLSRETGGVWILDPGRARTPWIRLFEIDLLQSPYNRSYSGWAKPYTEGVWI